jgi:hypothetical protein
MERAMPKPFSISIEVEEASVGQVFRLLNRTPGVVKLHLDLDEAKKTRKLNGGGERKPRKSGGRLKLYSLLAGGKPATTEQINAAMQGEDMTPTTVRNVLYNSQRQGFIKAKSKGQYVLTDKGKRRFAQLTGDGE